MCRNNQREVGDEKVPYFIGRNLLTKEKIEQIANDHLQGTGMFLTSVKVSADNHITVRIDGDDGVSIGACVDLSRAIESSLDRDREDFSLDVSSHGATSPLVMPRQFRRHIGRELELKLEDGSRAEGKLASCSDDGIGIEYSVREAKPVGKGKVTVVKRNDYRFSDIREARIKLKY